MDQQNKVQINIPTPPREVFEHSKTSTLEYLTHQPQPIYVITHFEYPREEDGGGIYIHYQGVPYPKKGFPTPEACQANNTAKRVFISIVKWLKTSPLALISLLWKKNLEKFLKGLTEVFIVTLGQYYLIDYRYSYNCREYRKLIKNFLVFYGISESTADGFAQGFETILEYDDAYLFRIQDLMSETTAEKLTKDPRGEFKRLLSLSLERDTRVAVKEKFKAVIGLLSWAFFLPGVKKAFIKAVKSVEFKNLQLDEGDKYNVLRWSSYNFMGRPFDARIAKYKEIHKDGFPPSFLLDSSWTHDNRDQGNGKA